MIGMPEMVVVGVVVGLLFGTKKLPEMGRSLGEGIREFKKSMQGVMEDDNGGNQTYKAAEVSESKTSIPDNTEAGKVTDQSGERPVGIGQ